MTRDMRRGLTGKQQWAIVLACVAVLGGVLFISTLLVLVIGFAADLLQRLVDPRLRGRRTGA